VGASAASFGASAPLTRRPTPNPSLKGGGMAEETLMGAGIAADPHSTGPPGLDGPAQPCVRCFADATDVHFRACSPHHFPLPQARFSPVGRLRGSGRWKGGFTGDR
jgi:hypothetical protein